MRDKKKIIAFFLALAMLFCLCSCDYAFEKAEELESVFGEEYSFREDIVSFEEMKYIRPDMNEIKACADEISDLLDGWFTGFSVAEKLNDFYTLYYNFYSMNAIARIRSDLNINDEYYLEEYNYCNNCQADVDNILDDIICDCANSHHARFLNKYYFDYQLYEFVTDSDGNDTSDEVQELRDKENELLNNYHKLVIEMHSGGDEIAYADFNEDICNIYIELIKLRHEIADKLGCDSYEQLCCDNYNRGYSIEELHNYAGAIKKHIIPLFEAAYKSYLFNGMQKTDKMDAGEVLERVKNGVSGMGDDFKEAMQFMEEYGLYDISAADSKFDGSYEIYIDNYDTPFLFSKTNGYSQDILSVAHEFGHFADDYLNYSLNLSLDSTEMFSQGMEYMLLLSLDDGALKESLTKYKMLDLLFLYANQTSFWEFEERVYALSDDELNVDKINSIFEEVANEYGYGVCYPKDELRLMWIDIEHIFEQPFYVISYCVSDSAAFSLYNMELNERGSGLAKYKALMRKCSELEFVELLKEEKMASPITEDAVKSIAKTLSQRLGI